MTRGIASATRGAEQPDRNEQRAGDFRIGRPERRIERRRAGAGAGEGDDSVRQASANSMPPLPFQNPLGRWTRPMMTTDWAISAAVAGQGGGASLIEGHGRHFTWRASYRSAPPPSVLAFASVSQTPASVSQTPASAFLEHWHEAERALSAVETGSLEAISLGAEVERLHDEHRALIGLGFASRGRGMSP